MAHVQIEIGRDWRDIGYVTTDEEGAFSVTVPPGAHPASVAPYHGGASGSLALPLRVPCGKIDRSDCVVARAGETTWWNVTLPAGGAIEGFVRESGGEGASATLRIGNESAYASFDGRFRVVMAPGAYALRAYREYAYGAPVVEMPCAQPDASDCARVVAGETTWINVTLPALAELRGYVLHPDGTPVRATVQLDSPADDAYESTLGDGSYHVTVRPGNYSLRAGPQSHLAMGLQTFELPCVQEDASDCVQLVAGQTTWRNITLAQSAVLRGFVRGPDGEPVRGGSVSADDGARRARDAYVGYDGSYALELEPGAYAVGATAYSHQLLGDHEPQCDPPHPDGCAIVREGETTWWNITLPRAASLRGYARLPDGTPLAGATVQAHGPGGSGQAFADETGAFLMRAPRGPFGVVAEPTLPHLETTSPQACRWEASLLCEDHASGGGNPYYLYDPRIAGLAAHVTMCVPGDDAACIEMEDGETRWHNITFQPAISVRGVVRDARGDVVPHAFVWASGSASSAHDQADANGSFALWLVPGEYAMNVEPGFSADGWTRNDSVAEIASACGARAYGACVTFDGDAWWNVTLPDAGHVRGVLTHADGSPAVHASLVLWHEDEGMEREMTDAEGRYAVSIAPGAYRLRIETSDWYESSAAAPAYALPCDPCLEVNAGENLWWNVTLPEMGLVRGVVRDAQGRPAEAVAVSAEGLAGHTAWTSRNGSFALALPPGAHNLVAVRHGLDGPRHVAFCGDAAAPCVDVRVDAESVVDLELAPHRTVARAFVMNEHVNAWRVLGATDGGGRAFIALERDWSWRPLGDATARIDGAPARAWLSDEVLLLGPLDALPNGTHAVEVDFPGASPLAFTFGYAPPAPRAPPTPTPALAPEPAPPEDPTPEAAPTPAPATPAPDDVAPAATPETAAASPTPTAGAPPAPTPAPGVLAALALLALAARLARPRRP